MNVSAARKGALQQPRRPSTRTPRRDPFTSSAAPCGTQTNVLLRFARATTVGQCRACTAGPRTVPWAPACARRRPKCVTHVSWRSAATLEHSTAQLSASPTLPPDLLSPTVACGRCVTQYNTHTHSSPTSCSLSRQHTQRPRSPQSARRGRPSTPARTHKPTPSIPPNIPPVTHTTPPSRCLPLSDPAPRPPPAPPPFLPSPL